MAAKPIVVLANEFHPDTIRKLDSIYSTYHFWELHTAEKHELIQELGDSCEAVASASWVFDEIVYGLPALKLIACFGVGVDAIDFQLTRSRNIQVSNTPDVLNYAVADIAISLILAITRNIISADRFIRNKQWKNGPFPFGIGLNRKVLGIIGFGRIGEEIAKRAQTFGLNIAYHNRKPKDLPFTYHPSITELAAASDILLCMLPGGDETKNLIDAEIFKALGPAGIFLNVGRGSSVDEGALVSALQEKQIAAAGLDVYADEPNVPEALLTMDNVVLLPHIGSATVETRRAMGDLVIQNLEAFFANRPLLTEVK